MIAISILIHAISCHVLLDMDRPIQPGCASESSYDKTVDNNNDNSCIYNAHLSIQWGCSRRNILLLLRSLDTISRPHLQYTISTPKGAFLVELPMVAFRQIHTQHILHILPGTHLYTWVKSSNVDKVSCWRTKVPGIDGNRTCNPLIQNQGFTPIYHDADLWVSTCDGLTNKFIYWNS